MPSLTITYHLISDINTFIIHHILLIGDKLQECQTNKQPSTTGNKPPNNYPPQPNPTPNPSLNLQLNPSN